MKTILISGSSDIGKNIILELKKKNHKIVSTYNKSNKTISEIDNLYLDISSREQIFKFLKTSKLKNWDNLIILPATQKPIGLFVENDPSEWAKSIDLNFTNQMMLLNGLIKLKSNKKRKVILWAGGGVNNATKYYSAYTVSKIAQIKITELLNHELKNVSFTILGPGWVKTKIHKQTLNNPKNARENFIRTKKRYKSNNFVPIKKVTDCVLKVLASKNKFFDGRNISVENDLWMNDSFLEILSEDENIYKLRRDFNDFKFSDLQFNIIDILDLLLKNRNFQKPNSLIYKTFKRILHMRFVLEQRRNKIGHTIKADDISKIINLYTKKNKNKKIINSCLDSKSIKLKKLLSILK